MYLTRETQYAALSFLFSLLFLLLSFLTLVTFQRVDGGLMSNGR